MNKCQIIACSNEKWKNPIAVRLWPTSCESLRQILSISEQYYFGVVCITFSHLQIRIIHRIELASDKKVVKLLRFGEQILGSKASELYICIEQLLAIAFKCSEKMVSVIDDLHANYMKAREKKLYMNGM